MSKRKNGEGSYGKKAVKGYIYHYYTAPNQEWTVYGKTLKEVKEKKSAKEETYKKVDPMPAPITTVYDVCEQWLGSIRNKVSPNTYDAYEDIVRVRIKDYKPYNIGYIQAQAVTPALLTKYLDSLKDKYASASIRKTLVVLKQALEYGQKHNYVPKTLKMDEIERPSDHEIAKKKKEIQFTTLEDMEILYNEANKLNSRGGYVYGNSAKVLIFIMYSGVRIGEAIALTWKYVLNNCSKVRIQHSNRRIVKRDSEGNAIFDGNHRVYEPFQKETKTESGERIIPLPDRAIEVLRYFDAVFPDHNPEDHVFLTKTGKIYDRTNLEHTLQRLMNNSNCSNKNYTPHSLRHGYGSILLSQGVDIKTVSMLLGHKDISTTYNIYIHVLEEDKEKAVIDVFNKKKLGKDNL